MSLNQLTPFSFSFINSSEQCVDFIKILSKVYMKSTMDTIIRVKIYVLPLKMIWYHIVKQSQVVSGFNAQVKINMFWTLTL